MLGHFPETKGMNESDKIPNFNFESSFFQFKFVGFLSVKDSGKINSMLKSFSPCVTQRQITALTFLPIKNFAGKWIAESVKS